MDIYYASHKSLNLLNDESHRIFKGFVEEIDTPLFMVDEHDKIFYGNPAFKALWDPERQGRVLGANWLHLVFSDPSLRADIVSRLASSGHVKDFEFQAGSFSGQKIVLLFSANVIRDDQGKTIGMRGAFLDITHRSALARELSKEHERLLQILDLCNSLGHFFNDTDLTKHIVEQTASIFGASRCSLMYIDAPKNELFVKSAFGVSEKAYASRVKVGQPVSGILVLQGRSVLVEDIERDDVFCKENRQCYQSGSFLSVPVVIGQKVIGLINVSGRDKPFTRSDLKVLETIAIQASINLNKVQTMSSLVALSQVDAMTDLLNYRSFIERLKEELSRAGRYERPFCLVMADVDNFKPYNDSHGHLAGDALLRRLGEVLKSGLRDSDAICRYGGDEFAIILSETGMDEAVLAVEKVHSLLRKAFEASRITLSMGIAQYSQGDDSMILIHKADQALYAAKNSGRNKASVSLR